MSEPLLRIRGVRKQYGSRLVLRSINLKQRGLTILMATHEMGFARQVADQVCFLEDGVIVEQGTAEQVLTAPRQQATQRFLSRVLDHS